MPRLDGTNKDFTAADMAGAAAEDALLGTAFAATPLAHCP